MIKYGQFASFYAPGLSNKTLHDLYRAIEMDASLSNLDRIKLINQIRGLTNHASSGTPLSMLMASGLGGTIGYLISKYFGLSPTGKAVGAALGVGLGRMLFNQFNKPMHTGPKGFRVIT